MQRLHCWFDQLTLRRARRRDAKRDASRRGVSVAANCRLADERQLKAVPVPCVPNSKPRQGIRTNPWLYTSYPPSATHYPRLDDPAPVASLDRRRPPTLGVSRLDESTCSSGYGSQDCSPDSSVHQPPWQTSSSTWSHHRKPPRESWNDEYGSFLDETDSFYDNICDEHVYHELEAICRRPERSYSSDCLSCESPQPRADSPIYAQPWSNHWTTPPRELPNKPKEQPLVVRNQSFQGPSPRRLLPQRPSSPIYATPYIKRPEPALIYPGSFLSRCEKRQQRVPEPSKWHQPSPPESLEAAEEEFLTELDAQINELQQRSDELRQLVERARQRRQTSWSRPTLECTFELDL